MLGGVDAFSNAPSRYLMGTSGDSAHRREMPAMQLKEIAHLHHLMVTVISFCSK
jgi:hypothetical protein